MEKMIIAIVKPLILNHDKLSVEKEQVDEKTIYHLNVDKEDMGKIIGKQGQVARAIRTILYESAKYKKERIRLDFHAL